EDQHDAGDDRDDIEVFVDELAGARAGEADHGGDEEEAAAAAEDAGEGEAGEVELGDPGGDGEDLVGDRGERGDEDGQLAVLLVLAGHDLERLAREYAPDQVRL